MVGSNDFAGAEETLQLGLSLGVLGCSKNRKMAGRS
jgi:hypothetical protein